MEENQTNTGNNTEKAIVEIDNNKGVGYAVVDGQEWTARSEDDAVIIPEDSVVTIVGISGVKLIVRELTKKGE